MARLTLKQMADHLSITPKTFRKYITEQQIPFVQIGKRKRFDPAEVERHLLTRGEAALPKGVKRVVSYRPQQVSKYAERLGL